MFGFYLTKFEVKGDNKRTKDISFVKGLNFIAGASNTGKTFIYQCLEYCLGGSSNPKSFAESKGYDTYIITIKDYEGNQYKIKRERKENEAVISSETFDEDKQLPATFSDKSYTLSDFYLELCGLSDRKVITNQSGDFKNVTFRNLSHFYMLNEDEIIKSSSPTDDGSYVNRTFGENAFKMLISNDFFFDKEEAISTKREKEKNEKKISKIKQRKEIYSEQLDEVKKDLENIETTPLFDQGIEELENKFHNDIQEAQKIHEQIQTKNEVIDEINDRISKYIKLEERFDLLREQYQTDEKRLNFILEGEHYLFNLETVSCPVCERPIEDHEYENICVDNIEHDQFLSSIKAELDRVYKHKSDLENTLESLEKELTEAKERKSKFKKERADYKEQLKLSFIPKLKDNQSIIDEYTKIQSLKNEQKRYQSLIDSAEEKISSLNKEIEAFDKNTNKHDDKIFLEHLDEYLAFIETRLEKWEIFEDPNVEFDKNNMDLEINSELRSSFGKGYKAILNTIFILSILEHCYDNAYPNFGFNIVDTPLGNYREEIKKDLQKEVKIDLILTEINNSFSDKQVIFFDHKLPATELEELEINIFSKNEDFEREGFF